MRSLIEYFHAHRHTEGFEIGLDLLGHFNGRATVDAIIGGVYQKHGRAFLLEYEWRVLLPPVPGRETHREVRPAAHALYWIGRLRVTSIVVGGEVHAEIAACGVSGDAYLPGIERPFRRVKSHGPHRALRIQQRQGL